MAYPHSPASVTPRSLELRALAERIADCLPAVAEEIVLTGSTSRGVADDLSDIELLVVASELPRLSECVRFAEAAGLVDVETWTPPGAAVYWSGGFIDGEFAELIWWPRSYVEDRVRAILAAEVIEHAQVRTADALANGIALRGHALVEWQARLASYPDTLAERIVASAAETWHEHPRSERALLRPGDTLALAQRLAGDAENVVRIVFAVNRAWEPGWKRLAQSLEALPLQPEGLAERLSRALSTLNLQAMRELVRDTLALAPDIPEVTRARAEVAAFLK
jgi:predicted nucleotidyltransferase